MFENTTDRVPSKGAVIGVESYSGHQAFDLARAEANAGVFLSADCDAVLFAPLVGETIMTFSMDLRGQVLRGTHVAEDGGFTLADYNEDFNRVRKSLNAEKVVLNGYSHAGFSAARFALAHPERVEALILIEPNFFDLEDRLLKWAKLADDSQVIESLEQTMHYVNPELKGEELRRGAEFVRRAWQSSAMIADAYRMRAKNPISEEELSKLEVPTLLIGGTASAMKFNVKRAAAAIPHANVYWAHGANHFDLVANPDYAHEIAAVMEQFITTHSRSIQARTC